MKKMFSEFSAFISKGNVIGLAVGLMMGTAFNAIITSLINDIFMPIIGLITSGVSFQNWFVPLNGESYPTLKAAQDAGAPIITIGNFISAFVTFIIIAIVLFFVMKAMGNFMKALEKKEAEAQKPAEPSDEVKLLTEIRDALKSK